MSLYVNNLCYWFTESCGPGQFFCDAETGGKCIPEKWKCDHEADCNDRSDEPPECCNFTPGWPSINYWAKQMFFALFLQCQEHAHRHNFNVVSLAYVCRWDIGATVNSTAVPPWMDVSTILTRMKITVGLRCLVHLIVTNVKRSMYVLTWRNFAMDIWTVLMVAMKDHSANVHCFKINFPSDN